MARDRRPLRPVPRTQAPAPGEPWGRTARQPGVAGPTVRLTGRLAAGYGRWVAASPETRGLGSVMAALYPAGEIGHLVAR